MIYILEVVEQIQVQTVWNPRDFEGDKMFKGIKHLVEALAPLSLPQISRIIKAGRLW